MRTLSEIYRDGIKDEDWTYCKPEYAPHDGCKVGMPKEFTPDETKRNDISTCYIVAGKYYTGKVEANDGMMYLDDGKFYWYDNLWDDDEEAGKEKTDIWFIEPIAWIQYRNIPECNTNIPVPPFNNAAVPAPIRTDLE